jgi:hypothetical protein
MMDIVDLLTWIVFRNINEMQITQFSNYIFWQYKPDADLPDLVVLENLLLYGDLDELLKISQYFSKQQITEVQKK